MSTIEENFDNQRQLRFDKSKVDLFLKDLNCELLLLTYKDNVEHLYHNFTTIYTIDPQSKIEETTLYYYQTLEVGKHHTMDPIMEGILSCSLASSRGHPPIELPTPNTIILFISHYIA
jgi:hypothetical protein